MSAIAVPAGVRQPAWRRLIGFNLLSAIVLAVVGWLIGNWIGGADPRAEPRLLRRHRRERHLGVARLPVRRDRLPHRARLRELPDPAAARPPAVARRARGRGRRASAATSGCAPTTRSSAIQYIVGIGVFFFVGGLNAMLIRTELLQPNTHVFGANQYLTLVGMHGAMMMGMMTSVVLGPFANWLVPLMIGSRRMAFPRIEAFTFWLLMAAGVVLVTTIFFGGFQTGWTGYQPLGGPGHRRLRRLHRLLRARRHLDVPARLQPAGDDHHDARAGDDVVAAADLRLDGARDRGADAAGGADADRDAADGRARPDRADELLRRRQRAAAPTCTRTCSGCSDIPRCTSSRCPGFGIVLELLPVFSRKPLWGYRLAVAGMLGVALLSFFVWQHHLFVSGINADLRPFYMLSTELISLPTGFIFLCAMGTMWRGRIRFTVPMLFCLGWVFNFLFGGISGVFLSDVPSDVTTHGSVLLDGPLPLHDHGRAGVHGVRRDLLLGPEDDRLQLQRAARQDPLLVAVHRLQLDLRAAVRARLHGHAATRGHLPDEPPGAQRLGLDLGVRDRALDARVPRQRDLVAAVQARARGSESVAFEVAGVAAADAGAGARLRPDPGVRRRPVSVRRRAGAACPPLAPAGGTA